MIGTELYKLIVGLLVLWISSRLLIPESDKQSIFWRKLVTACFLAWIVAFAFAATMVAFVNGMSGRVAFSLTLGGMFCAWYFAIQLSGTYTAFLAWKKEPKRLSFPSESLPKGDEEVTEQKVDDVLDDEKWE